MFFGADQSALEEIGRFAGGGAFGALLLGLAQWALNWRRAKIESDRAGGDIGEAERQQAMAERKQSLAEVWAIVEDLRSSRSRDRDDIVNLTRRVTELEGELRHVNRDNLRLRRMVILSGGDPDAHA